jgi:cation transport regulator ChaC
VSNPKKGAGEADFSPQTLHSPDLWYFAYGSNMSAAVFRERRGIQPLAAERGYVDGYRLCFNIPIGPGERGVANLIEAHGVRTHGVLYLLTAEQCDHLDHTEGVHMNVYRRIPVQAVAATGDPVAAFTYQSSLTAENRKPSARYLNLLLDGAAEHRLPDDYRRLLNAFDLAVDERVGKR